MRLMSSSCFSTLIIPASSGSRFCGIAIVTSTRFPFSFFISVGIVVDVAMSAYRVPFISWIGRVIYIAMCLFSWPRYRYRLIFAFLTRRFIPIGRRNDGFFVIGAGPRISEINKNISSWYFR